MLTLANPELTVDLLDPRSPATQARQGTRYCWGGYIWQVRDSLGDLLAGPEYPEPQPIPFNGQGLPEAFRSRDRTSGRRLTVEQYEGMVLGAGEVALGEGGSLGLLAPAVWQVQLGNASGVFQTSQRFRDWTVELTRRVTLQGRTVVSETTLLNRGPALLPLQWFPHPFFQLTAGRIVVELSPGFGVAENPMYVLSGNTLQMKEAIPPGHGGYFQLLQVAPVPLTATCTHPRLSYVRMSCDFVAAEIPVWANHHTFSIEPYLVADLSAGEQRSWSVRYEFGLPKGA